jgi:hypothetical protein
MQYYINSEIRRIRVRRRRARLEGFGCAASNRPREAIRRAALPAST